MEMADRQKPTKIMNVYGEVYQVAKFFSRIPFPSRPHIKKLEIVTITQDLLLGHGFTNLKAVYLICEDFQDDERVRMYEKYSALIESREMHYEVILHCPAKRATCDTEPHEEDPRTIRM